MTPTIAVLLIEDNRIEAHQIQNWLKTTEIGRFEITWVDKLGLGLACVAAGRIEIVLLDLNLPDSHGIGTYLRFHEQEPDIPVVVLTGD